MPPPRKAIILAAGYGTRLEPLTRALPKCLLPLWGRPILDHTLATLAAWGVRDVLVNLHHAPQPLFDHLRQNPHPRLRVSLSYEPDILGTGGALTRAAWFLHGNEPLWMVNGDIVFNCDPRLLLRAFTRSHKTLAALLMTSHSGPRTVELHPSGAIKTFRSPHPTAPGTKTFCGLQLLSPSILRYVADLPSREGRPPGRPPSSPPVTSIITAYESAARAGWTITGVDDPRAVWFDIGTPEGLLAAHAKIRPPAAMRRTVQALRRRGVTIAGFAAIGNHVSIAPGAHLQNVIALDNAVIAANARITNAILAPHVHATGAVRRLAVPLAHANDPDFLAIAKRLRWPAATTVVQPLAPRGSARTFTRLVNGRQRVIVMRHGQSSSPGAERPENARFVSHARFLSNLGIRVPRVLLDMPDSHLAVVEDLGERDLALEIRGASAAKVLRTYQRVIPAVAHWHRVTGPAARRHRLALEPAFSLDLYRWERELFSTHYLAGRLNLPKRASAAALRDLSRVATRLAAEPTTLVHRDLQSTNILFAKTHPAFIDFQGMRLGPAVYDLASLLADPYVMLPSKTQSALLDQYIAASNITAPAPFRDAFWHGAVQRLVQALGAYGRLSRLPGTAAFAQYIPPALEMLDRALSHLYTLHNMQSFVRQLRNIEASRGAA